MNISSSLQERITLLSETCAARLQQSPLVQVSDYLGHYSHPAAAFELLSGARVDPEKREELRRVCTVTANGPRDTLIERTLLVLACQHGAARIPDLPVADRVKQLFVEEFEFFINPSDRWLPHFRAEDVRYQEMVRVATFHRFPAGQFQWEISGFPRSWLLKASQMWSLIKHIFLKMKGFSPVFELHLNERRKNRLTLLEKEGNLSFYRAARSLEKQPAVKGLMLNSWFFCESTARVSPHLAWLRRIPRSAGALVVDLGAARSDSGFLTGSEERRKLYEQGTYSPQSACVLWPRTALISWANEHPEFDE